MLGKRLPYILGGGEQGCIIVQRMRAAIGQRTPSGGTLPAFSLAINVTKVPQLAEASQGYHAIIGLEYPDHILDIVGKSKEDVKLVLNGKDPKIGKLALASEVKVTVMLF